VKAAAGDGVVSTGDNVTRTPHVVSVGGAKNSQPRGLAAWPSAGHLQYVCPSEKLTTTPELVILEETRNAVFYDLPELPTLTSLIIDPRKVKEIADPNRSTSAPKEARQIMQIRRKKMKRHLLKKYRKRMKFTLRKNKREREKRKEAAFQARLADIKAWGDNFDARYDCFVV
jgi:hypothetical protein